MKKSTLFVFFLTLSGQLFFTSCNNTSDNNGTDSETVERDVNLIVNIHDIAGKPLAEVEQILGKAESQEPVKGYPCKTTNCLRGFFQNGKFEVIFKHGKADRITINQTPDLTNTESAITALGLPKLSPSFANPSTIMRWERIENLHEVAFFTNYVLIQVNRPE